jgi:hypothetical protein
LTDAWRQVHYAAQAASEVGKSWAAPRDDDGHTNLGWLDDPSQPGFQGVSTQTDPTFHACLDPRSLRLELRMTDGISPEELPLQGRTLAEAMTWVDAAAARLGGPRRQAAVPAPDLPEHPIARGETFSTGDAAALQAVTDWYANADALLRKLGALLPDAGPPRCWPHHMDHATLSIIRRDAEGAMTATIGVGITPPDEMETRGYWYVGPWSREPIRGGDAWPELPFGHWVARAGGMPLGVLPLTEIATLDGAAAQEHAAASFVAAAVNTCRTHLT